MSSSNRSPLLLDVGGTFIKCEDGRQVPIHSDGTVQEISAALRAAAGPAPADGVGVAIPGPFDYREGIFRMTHKFAAVNGMPFRELAGIPDEVPLRMMHDVNAALLGAHVLSGQQGNAALVTMGTGLGFAYSIDGRPQCNDAGSPARSLYNLPYVDGILEMPYRPGVSGTPTGTGPGRISVPPNSSHSAPTPGTSMHRRSSPIWAVPWASSFRPCWKNSGQRPCGLAARSANPSACWNVRSATPWPTPFPGCPFPRFLPAPSLPDSKPCLFDKTYYLCYLCCFIHPSSFPSGC